MARPSKITLALPTITSYINSTRKSVYNKKELITLLEEKSGEWGLPNYLNAQRVIERLVKIQFIIEEKLHLSNDSYQTLYLYGEPSIYEIASAIRPRSYVSHYPAVHLHELTTQVPKTIYTTQEQSKKLPGNKKLEQSAIDHAFAQPQRRSQLAVTYRDYTIVLLSGMNSSQAGVLKSTRYSNAFSFTNVERTLIDIAVRPNYAGGSFEVLNVFREAISRKLFSGAKLSELYHRLGFTYPYHQVLGFYLDKSGANQALIDSFKVIPMDNQFYLDYNMQEKKYDTKWKLWYPKGM